MVFKKIGERNSETGETVGPKTLEEDIAKIINSVQLGEFATKEFGQATDWGYEYAIEQIKQAFEKHGYHQPTTDDTPDK